MDISHAWHLLFFSHFWFLLLMTFTHWSCWKLPWRYLHLNQSLAIQGESQVTYKSRCPLPMRQFPLWNKPITHSLDTLKWQIKCLRHSLITWIQLSEDINGFPLYLHLPSGCFDFLKLWRLKWWYLRIISSEIEVRTPGKVLRHSVRVSVSLPNWCFSELYRLVEHAQETSKHREGGKMIWKSTYTNTAF